MNGLLLCLILKTGQAMSNRYQNTSIGISNKKRYYKTIIYPQIDPKPDDVYVITVFGDRLESLAYDYYGDVSLWWIISSSNNIPKDSIFIPVGSQIRIPSNISKYLNEFDELNQSR
jgi:hypothetical protein